MLLPIISLTATFIDPCIFHYSAPSDVQKCTTNLKRNITQREMFKLGKKIVKKWLKEEKRVGTTTMINYLSI